MFNKPIWQQMVIVLAGIFMNFIGAAVLFAMVFMIGTKPIVVQIQDEGANGILSQFAFESYLIPQYESIEAAQESGMVTREVGVLLSPVD